MDARCTKCISSLEKPNHMFWVCSDANLIWKALLPVAALQKLQRLSFEDWMRANISGNFPFDYSMD